VGSKATLSINPVIGNPASIYSGNACSDNLEINNAYKTTACVEYNVYLYFFIFPGYGIEAYTPQLINDNFIFACWSY
jgi:hypothetical protein